MSKKEKYIKGEVAKKINDFKEAHPEIDLGWLDDIILAVYEYARRNEE